MNRKDLDNFSLFLELNAIQQNIVMPKMVVSFLNHYFTKMKMKMI